MNRLITIGNWWDGPIIGLAQLDDIFCIYERVFDEATDEWSNEYLLTPVNEEEKRRMMDEWKCWCDAIDGKTNLGNYYATHSHSNAIETILKNSQSRQKYRKKASFKGKLRKGFIPLDTAYVEWND